MKKPLLSPEQQIRKALLEATEESSAMVEARSLSPRAKKSAANYKRIHDLSCSLLADSKHPVYPDAAALSRISSSAGMPFLAKQTLKNRYRDMIKVWTAVFKKITSIRAAAYVEAESRRTRGVSLEIQSLQDMLRVLYIENCELRRLVGERPTPREPVSEGSAKAPIGPLSKEDNILVLTPLREWLKSLEKESAFLVEAKHGLKLKANARPGFIIMDRSVFDLLKRL